MKIKHKFKWNLNTLAIVAAIVVALPVMGGLVIKLVQLWTLPDQVTAMQHKLDYLMSISGRPTANSTLNAPYFELKEKEHLASPKAANSP